MPPNNTSYRKKFVGCVVHELYKKNKNWEMFFDVDAKHPEPKYKDLYRFIVNKLNFVNKKVPSAEKAQVIR